MDQRGSGFGSLRKFHFCSMEEPPLAAEEPPLAAEEPPLAAEEPPLAAEEPPLAAEEPPLAAEDVTAECPDDDVPDAPVSETAPDLTVHDPEEEEEEEAQRADPAVPPECAAAAPAVDATDEATVQKFSSQRMRARLEARQRRYSSRAPTADMLSCCCSAAALPLLCHCRL